MLAFSALVAGSFSLGAMSAPLVDPAALTALRFWIAAALLGGWGLATKGLTAGAFRAPWRYAALGGLFSIYFVLMFEGLKTAEPVATAAVFTLTPVMAAGFGWLLLRQRMTPRIALALAVGAAGALWVIFRGDLDALVALRIGRGESIYFLGCVIHALYTPMVRLLNRGESALAFSFGTLLAGAVALTVWSFPALLATDWAHLAPIVWITLVYISVFASAATFVLLQFAAIRLPASKVMAYTYLVPSWVILWQIGLGHRAPPALVVAGVAMTAVALFLLLKDEERPAR